MIMETNNTQDKQRERKENMEKKHRRLKFWGILLGLCLFAAGFTIQSTAVETQAATQGFRTSGGKTYYYKDGKKVKSWITIGKKKYYLDRRTGVLKKGWLKSKGRKRYFDPKTGALVTGLKKISGKYYYFDNKTGWAKSGFVSSRKGNIRYFAPKTYEMQKGWVTVSGKKYYIGKSGAVYKGLKKIGKYSYYFDYKTGAAKSGFITSSKGYTRYFRRKTYKMATGWLKNSQGQKRYFNSKGVMYKGRKRVSGKYYFFDKSSGLTRTGWITDGGVKRYYDTKTFAMVTGTRTINGIKYSFNSDGTLKTAVQDRWTGLLAKYQKNPLVKQLIFVQYKGGSRADVILYTRTSGTSAFKKTMTCAGYVGSNGINKVKEGDRRTPTGEYGFSRAFGINSNPGSKVRYTKLDGNMYWCADKYYNRLVSTKLNPHRCTGEHLIDYDPQYRYALALNYNPNNIKGKGSGIFLHCKGNYNYTGGCISVGFNEMLKIIRTVDSNAKICIYNK